MSCSSVWDGFDFSPCFREHYLENVPLALTALGGVVTLLYCRKKSYVRINASDLVSPNGDNTSRLEADVLMASVAESVLPPVDRAAEAEERRPLPPREADRIVDDFRRTTTKASRSWDFVYRTTSVLGAAAWCAVQGAAVLWAEEDWRTVVFPAFIFVASVVALRYPRLPLLPLITCDLLPSLLLFRSNAIHGASHLALAPACVHLGYWSCLMCVPYYDSLDRILDGAVSHGGIGAPPLARHLEEPTSAMSRGTYWFIVPFLWKYWWKPVKQEEIPALREDDGAAASLGSFRKFQADRDTKYAERHGGAVRKSNLGADLIAFFRPLLVEQVVWALLFTVLQYLPPVAMRLLLKFIAERETTKQPAHMAYIYVFMMVLGQSIGYAIYGQALMIGRRICIRLRSIIVGAVFTKALRREDRSGTVRKTKNINKPEEEGAEQASTDGKIANLVSVDAFYISEVCAYCFYLVSTPVAIVLNVALLYATLGQSAIAGIVVLVLLIPVQTIMAKLMARFQTRLLTATDKRLEQVTEVINFVRLLKFNSWQDKFLDRMKGSRRGELKALAQLFVLLTLQGVLAWGTPVFVTVAAFGWQVLVVKEPLTADVAFSSLLLFQLLRDPVAILQETITEFVRAYTSCVRIQAFLEEPETLKYRQLSKPGPSDPTVGFRDAIFAYPTVEEELVKEEVEGSEGSEGDDQPFRLGQLDLNFPTGQLSLIAGPVGSGKSTLILSLLGETVLLQGKVFMPDDHANRDICPVDPQSGLADTVAYCAQTPWLVGASIRDNITFGAPWDASRYDKVVDCCALRRDFEIFELGDLTEVGEKGTTCSGGQKARIALARAIYSPSKTVILDDVLSAVDAQTARHIYKNVLQGSLMEGRTCILVTHAVSLCLPAAAFVVMLDDGRVAASGTPSELAASGTLAVEDLTDSHPDDTEDASESTAGGSAFVDGEETIEDNLDGAKHDALVAKKAADADKAAELENKKLVQEETSSQGATSLRTYLLYFQSMGGLPFWLLAITALVGTQVLQVLTTAWVKDWTNSNDPAERVQSLKTWANALGVAREKHSTKYFVVGYLIISILYLVGVAARTGITCWGSLRASSRLYSALVRRLLNAKMRFFDSTPSGRIINRLSRDMVSIDQQSAEIMTNFINCVLSCAAVLAVVTYSSPQFIYTLGIIIVLYYMVGSLYITTNRELKRHDSVTRSPILQSFSEALTGSSTIRAYSDSARFIRKLLAESDSNTRCFWYLWQTNRVLNNLSNFVGSLITISACVLALSSSTMSAGDAGFSISYALSFTDYVLWIVRMYAAAEMSMNSVERVAEYLHLDVEEDDTKRGVEPPAYWPTKDGSVVVSNLTCKYAPQLEPVLKNVSFTIGPREKIGICGRTGSGKSTLALSFFRFLHQESGNITIDDLNISDLSLATLRSRLTILPQEAQLFSGSIRDNMDPFGQHEDVEIWEALRQCGLAGRTSANPSRAASRSHSRVASVANVDELRMSGGEAEDPGMPEEPGEPEERVAIRSLDDQVATGGKNFSQGQRQLLALARGLLKLKSSSFLIMDESTANLDHATDATIQSVLRTGLADTQMLVIAHRLMTVCGLDKILVLDHGKVVEFGRPWDLLQDEDGVFRDLCRQSGEESQLFEVARSVHERKVGKALV